MNEPSTGTKTAQGFVNAQEHVLGEILRFVITAGKPVADGVDTFGMRLDELFPGALLSRQAALNKAVFRFQSGSGSQAPGHAKAPQLRDGSETEWSLRV